MHGRDSACLLHPCGVPADEEVNRSFIGRLVGKIFIQPGFDRDIELELEIDDWQGFPVIASHFFLYRPGSDRQVAKIVEIGAFAVTLFDKKQFPGQRRLDFGHFS